MKSKNIFLTGPIRIGKSTILQNVLQKINIKNIGGFKTVPLVENGVRTGFAVRSFSGEERIFAHVDWETPHQFFNYHYDVSVFETFGVSILEKAMQRSDLIVMDEIGQMEAKTDKFQKTVLNCLDSPIPVLGVFQQRATWFREILESRRDVQIFNVGNDNRKKLVEKIVKIVNDSG